MADPVSLPIRTTLEDITALTGYLATKPMGASLAEAKAVIDQGVLDGRKVSAFKFWGLIEDVEGRLKLKELGRAAARDKGSRLAKSLQEIVRTIPAYLAIVERAIHKQEHTVTAVEVATHWHEHFKGVSSKHEKTLNDQAVCFFQIATGAKLGSLVIGRKGAPTRFEFSADALKAFGDDLSGETARDVAISNDVENAEPEALDDAPLAPAALVVKGVINNKVFITHGQNKKVLEQIKEIVAYGSYEPVIAQERESAAKPVPDKVMDEMRGCSAAVIHVSSEGTYVDAKGIEKPKINDNVLIEIGASMALYRRNFILVVEDGLSLPSNLQGLYECRYTGDELNTAATMKLLKAFKAFREE